MSIDNDKKTQDIDRFNNKEPGYRLEDFDTKIDYLKAKHLAYSQAKINDINKKGTYEKILITPKIFPLEYASCPNGWSSYSDVDEDSLTIYGFVTNPDGFIVLDWKNCEGWPL